MAVSLQPDTRRRVAASARLLLSDKPGEVAAAINAIGRLLPKGMTVPDLIEQSLRSDPHRPGLVTNAPSPVNLDPAWRRRARMARYSPYLNEWEISFLDSMIGQRSPSVRQEAKLKTIFAKSEGPRS